MKTVRVLGGCDCGGKVIVRDVEAVSPREVVVRRVLTADVDASLGHITWAPNNLLSPSCSPFAEELIQPLLATWPFSPKQLDIPSSWRSSTG